MDPQSLDVQQMAWKAADFHIFKVTDNGFTYSAVIHPSHLNRIFLDLLRQSSMIDNVNLFFGMSEHLLAGMFVRPLG